MVHVGNTTHGNEGEIVQDPADDRVDTSIVDKVNIILREVVVAALPANEVEDDNQPKDAETGSATPVDGRVTEEEVLDD